MGCGKAFFSFAINFHFLMRVFLFLFLFYFGPPTEPAASLWLRILIFLFALDAFFSFHCLFFHYYLDSPATYSTWLCLLRSYGLLFLVMSALFTALNWGSMAIFVINRTRSSFFFSFFLFSFPSFFYGRVFLKEIFLRKLFARCAWLR